MLSLDYPRYLLLSGAVPGALSGGTATFRLTATGDLKVPAKLAGTATFRLTASAPTLVEPVTLAGAATFALTATGGLAMPAAEFHGAAAFTLTATGALIAGLGAQLAGAATFRLTAAPASLVVNGIPIAGAALFTLTGTGELASLRAELAAQARFVLTAAGALANSPAMRPLRAATIHRPVGRVEQDGAPLPGVLRFTLESSLDTPSDGWTAEVAGAALMLAPDDDAIYSLPVGFLDAAGAEVLADHITSGRILDRRLVGRVAERRTYVRGVDALERTFRIQRRVRYVPNTEGATVGTVLSLEDVLQPALSARQAQLSTLQNVWGPAPPADVQAIAAALRSQITTLERGIKAAHDEAIPEKTGAWTAKSIAADLLEGTGLTLAWSARDYSLSVPFDAIGALYDLLRRLVEPWNQAPPLGVDVTAYGTVVYVRPRLRRPPPDLTMTIAESRLVELELGNRRRLPYIGVVDLQGRQTPAGGDLHLDPGDTTVFPPIGTMGSSEVDVPYSSPSYDGVGNEIARVEGVRTYRMPDRLLIRQIEHVSGKAPNGMYQEVKEESSETIYEDSRYGPQGPVNQPLPLSASKVIKTLVKVEGVGYLLSETQREQTTWKYDHLRYLETTATAIQRRYDVKPPGGGPAITTFPQVETLVETRTRRLDGWTVMLTTRTTFDPKTGQTASSSTMQPQDQAGLPPGGPRPPFSLFGDRLANDPTSGEAAAQGPVRLRETISTDPTAVPVSYSNPNLAEPDLQFILEQLREVSGLVEYPLRGSGPALPDVIKGSALLLTDYKDADGTPIPLEPALVRGIQFAYVDARARSEFTSALDAVFYRDE